MVAAPVATRPFVDSNVLLYLLSADTAKASRAEAVLAARVTISVQVLEEFTHVALRSFGLDWAETRQALADIQRFADVRAITAETHERGLALAELHGLGLYDAMIAAAALEAGCATLLSEDLQDGKRLGRRLVIRNPFI